MQNRFPDDVEMIGSEMGKFDQLFQVNLFTQMIVNVLNHNIDTSVILFSC